MRLDEGHRLTDEQLQELEERIREMYDEAAKELQDIIDDYFAKFAVRDKEMQDMLQAGKIDEEAYKQWRLNQIGRGRRFEQLRDKLAERATHANEVAVAYINDTTPGIYTLNRNYAAYEIESVGAGVDFTLYDEATIRRLLVERPDLMPYYPPSLALKRGIDLDYGKKQITARVTRGILMGESNRQIAAGLRERLTNMSVDSAIRAARTATTAAENGGRTASYQKAADMGIEMTREWLATRDGRTRHEHGVADGQRVGVKEPFTVGGEKLMFPGDASLGASGWNLYNCRCAVKAMVKGHKRTREVYSEWLERKMEEDPQGTTLEFKKQVRRNADYAQYQEYAKYARKETPNTFAKFQDLKYSNPNEWEKLKATKHQRETIKNAPCQTTPKKFSGYFLKDGTKHAKDFFDAGYSANDVLRLRYDIARQFDESKAEKFTIDEDGRERFRIYMKLGTKGQIFRTAWIRDTPESKPRITTAFREAAKDDKAF
nr:MAG TPA: minor capsid protein [Caudoviricetes sp.]